MSKLLDRIVEEAVNETADEVLEEKNKFETVVKSLRVLWKSGNSRKFMKAAYMHRKDLESINERYIDALEMINGYGRLLVREALMSNLLDFTEKYAEGKISKRAGERNCTFQYPNDPGRS